MITQEKLKTLLSYDPETGVFSRLSAVCGRRGKAKVGTIVQGYIAIRIAGRRYAAHRLAWLYMTGSLPEFDIDHKNGLKNDNRWSNLRHATRSENIANSHLSAANKVGFKGVYFDRSRLQFVAQIKLGYKKMFLGRFDSVADASEAYRKAASIYFGEFARTA